MLEKTDENHALTVNEIKDLLAAYGIRTERKALYCSSTRSRAPNSSRTARACG